MKNGLVTVVLPIYNVEKYLDDCINSVVSQTYKKLEILLINDGSNDSSAVICDKWAKLDSRIRVFHKENEGQGIARNFGIENATGEYICFFDSDDYIAEDTIEKSYSLAVKNKSEVVVFGMNSVDEDGNFLSSFLPEFEKSFYCGSEVQNDFFPEYLAPDPKGDGNGKFYMSSCFALYSMELINSISWRYVSERTIISEDVYSLIKLFKYVNSVSILPEALYYYRKNNTSFSNVYRADRYGKVRHFYVESKALCEQLGHTDEVIHRVSKPYLGYTIACLKQECISDFSFGESLQGIKKIVDDDVLQTVLYENRKDKAGLARKILFFSIRHKLYFLCAVLLNGKRLSAFWKK